VCKQTACRSFVQTQLRKKCGFARNSRVTRQDYILPSAANIAAPGKSYRLSL
jgi:hypothetical protein